MLLGVAMAQVGVCIMHDANHGAGGARARSALAATLDLVRRLWLRAAPGIGHQPRTQPTRRAMASTGRSAARPAVQAKVRQE